MELAAYIYDAWAYEQANQEKTDHHLFSGEELCADEDQVNKFDWNFTTIKQKAYLLSAIAFTSLSGIGWHLTPAMAAHVLEPSVNVAPWCNNLYLCNTSYMLEVQTLLAQRGFAVGAIDGVYGRYTKQAVIDFQRTQSNLVADGIPGEKTLALLRNSSVSKPLTPLQPNQPTGNLTPSDRTSPNPNQKIVIVRSNTSQEDSQQSWLSEIGNLQILLKRRGFYQGEIDGQMGETITNAILKAQKAYALPQDGLVGPLTIRSLLAGGNHLPFTQPALQPLPQSLDVQYVHRIQKLLKDRGFYDAVPSGFYDIQTKAGILKAQLAYGQPATGDLNSDVLLKALDAQKDLQNAVPTPSNILNNQNLQSPMPNNTSLGNGAQIPTSSQNAPAAKNSNSS